MAAVTNQQKLRDLKRQKFILSSQETMSEMCSTRPKTQDSSRSVLPLDVLGDNPFLVSSIFWWWLLLLGLWLCLSSLQSQHLQIFKASIFKSLCFHVAFSFVCVNCFPFIRTLEIVFRTYSGNSRQCPL